MSTSPLHETLLTSIRTREAKVGIVGLGYVGLPLALAFVEKGFPVLGFDVDPAKVDSLLAGESYIRHLNHGRVAAARKTDRFEATADFSRLGEPDALLICVPTPLTPQREPDMTHVEGTARRIRATLRPGQLVVLESTTYPGTTDELLRGLLDESGLALGTDYFLAFSPEREDPGNPDFGTTTIPKVVGGADETSGDLAQALYEQLVVQTVRVSSARAAEATKLMENIFRAVNIALVNDLKMIYDRMGIDIWEVLDAASTKPFGFMRFNPGPGWGGHCLDGQEWIRVRGLGCHGVYRFEELFDRLKDRGQAVATAQGVYLDTEGLQTLGLDTGSGELGWYPVTTLFRSRYQGSGRKIVTVVQGTLTVTDEHPMLLVRNGDIAVVPARTLAKGDRLPIASGLIDAAPDPGTPDDFGAAGEWQSLDVSTVQVDQLQSLAIDAWVYSAEVDKACTFTTSSGIVVHNCIPLDPFYLAWKAREHGMSPRFIELAGEVNVQMPHHVLGKLQTALNDRGKPVKGSKVLILGIAYKKDIDDPRESPAFELLDLLLKLGADVCYHDPHIPVAPRMRTWPHLPPLQSVELTPETLRAADAVLLITDHTAVDYAHVAAHASLIVDTRGVYRRQAGSAAATIVQA